MQLLRSCARLALMELTAIEGTTSFDRALCSRHLRTEPAEYQTHNLEHKMTPMGSQENWEGLGLLQFDATEVRCILVISAHWETKGELEASAVLPTCWLHFGMSGLTQNCHVSV